MKPTITGCLPFPLVHYCRSHFQDFSASQCRRARARRGVRVGRVRRDGLSTWPRAVRSCSFLAAVTQSSFPMRPRWTQHTGGVQDAGVLSSCVYHINGTSVHGNVAPKPKPCSTCCSPLRVDPLASLAWAALRCCHYEQSCRCKTNYLLNLYEKKGQPQSTRSLARLNEPERNPDEQFCPRSCVAFAAWLCLTGNRVTCKVMLLVPRHAAAC